MKTGGWKNLLKLRAREIIGGIRNNRSKVEEKKRAKN
jgi:hypothetical protein